MEKKDLEQRLIKFAGLIIKTTNTLPVDRPSNHLCSQLLRSGTSPALNYAEAQGGESRKDFIHKLKVSLKELRETFVCLKILTEAGYIKSDHQALKECDELIAIFATSVKTAVGNIASKK